MHTIGYAVAVPAMVPRPCYSECWGPFPSKLACVWIHTPLVHVITDAISTPSIVLLQTLFQTYNPDNGTLQTHHMSAIGPVFGAAAVRDMLY